VSISLKERIYEIYRTFSAGHFDQIADMFDERVDFISNAPVDVFPYLGHRVGKVQVMKALEGVHNEFSAVEYLPLKIMIDGQSAGVIVSIRLTQRTTRRLVRVFSAHFLQFKDNRIIEYRAFLDTLEAVQQVLGREFDLF
jgi:ketosteroid isomerase-like protein